MPKSGRRRSPGRPRKVGRPKGSKCKSRSHKKHSKRSGSRRKSPGRHRKPGRPKGSKSRTHNRYKSPTCGLGKFKKTQCKEDEDCQWTKRGCRKKPVVRSRVAVERAVLLGAEEAARAARERAAEGERFEYGGVPLEEEWAEFGRTD